MNNLYESSEFLSGIPFELSTCTPPCKVSDLNPSLLNRLVELYSKYPFTVNSAFRSVDWEHKHKRSGTSSHCKGLAVDLAVRNGIDRLKLVEYALKLGFHRIGIAKNFIHLDCDEDKPDSIWTYD